MVMIYDLISMDWLQLDFWTFGFGNECLSIFECGSERETWTNQGISHEVNCNYLESLFECLNPTLVICISMPQFIN